MPIFLTGNLGQSSSVGLLWLVRSGNVNSGSLNNSANNGNYWSSAADSGSNALNLNFNSGSINPANSNNKNNGFSVRCVAE